MPPVARKRMVAERTARHKEHATRASGAVLCAQVKIIRMAATDILWARMRMPSGLPRVIINMPPRINTPASARSFLLIPPEGLRKQAAMPGTKNCSPELRPGSRLGIISRAAPTTSFLEIVKLP